MNLEKYPYYGIPLSQPEIDELAKLNYHEPTAERVQAAKERCEQLLQLSPKLADIVTFDYRGGNFYVLKHLLLFFWQWFPALAYGLAEYDVVGEQVLGLTEDDSHLIDKLKHAINEAHIEGLSADYFLGIKRILYIELKKDSTSSLLV